MSAPANKYRRPAASTINMGRRVYIPNDNPGVAPRTLVKGHGPHKNLIPTKGVSFQIEDEDLPPPRSMAGEAKLTGTFIAPLPKTAVNVPADEFSPPGSMDLPPPRLLASHERSVRRYKLDKLGDRSLRSPFPLNGNEDRMSNLAALPPPRSMRKEASSGVAESQPRARTRADIPPIVWAAQVLELKPGTTSRENNTSTPVRTVERDPKASQPNHFIT